MVTPHLTPSLASSLNPVFSLPPLQSSLLPSISYFTSNISVFHLVGLLLLLPLLGFLLTQAWFSSTFHFWEREKKEFSGTIRKLPPFPFGNFFSLAFLPLGLELLGASLVMGSASFSGFPLPLAIFSPSLSSSLAFFSRTGLYWVPPVDTFPLFGSLLASIDKGASSFWEITAFLHCRYVCVIVVNVFMVGLFLNLRSCLGISPPLLSLNEYLFSSLISLFFFFPGHFLSQFAYKDGFFFIFFLFVLIYVVFFFLISSFDCLYMIKFLLLFLLLNLSSSLISCSTW